MIRYSLCWLFGIACGVALSFWALMPEIPAPERSAGAAPASPPAGETRQPVSAHAAPIATQASRPEPVTEVETPPRLPVVGEEDVLYTVYLLVDERILDPEADALPLIVGGGPPATLVCDYRSEADATMVTNSSLYDSEIYPPPSCPREIQLPAP